MDSTTNRACPVCSLPLKAEPKTTGHFQKISCPGCETFRITTRALASLPDPNDDDVKFSQAMRHYIWRKREGAEVPTINSDNVRTIKEDPWLPGIEEQMQNLILFLGNKSDGASADIDLGGQASAMIGVLASDDLWKLKQWAEEIGYVEDAGSSADGLVARLTLEGWQWYEEIKKGALHTNDVFMAMGYGNQELDNVVTNCIRPAVADTGFHLVRMDDRPEAGVMDNRMQIMIKRSRFLIAEVTDSNIGAYWEAG